MIKVIWSDDIFEDNVQVQASTEHAYDYGINLIARQTWDEVQRELEESGEVYDAVILDGKGQKSIDSKSNDTSHITQAVGWLSEQRGKGINYPIIIYTGNYEIMNELYADDKAILGIIKKPNMEAVYELIKGAVKESLNTKIKQNYQDTWKIFNNKILPVEFERKLLILINKYESQSIEQNDFNTIREILEGVLKKFNSVDNSDSLLPDDVLKKNGTINLEWSIRILKGLSTDVQQGPELVRIIPRNSRPVIPFRHHIGYCFDFVKDTSSALSHNYSHEYSKAIFPACLYSLMEILCWSNDLILNKYKHKLR